MRQYQREWIARRRATWFKGKVCVDCGSVERLEIDHVDPETKIANSIWSWSEARRNAELAKCVVRCRPCHWTKTMLNGEAGLPGEANPSSKLNVDQVLKIRSLAASGITHVKLGEMFGVHKRSIANIVNRRTWKLV